MAYSYTNVTADGATTQFTVTIPYLDRSHIKVFLNGVETSFSWLNDSLIEVTPAPANGTVVQIRRFTSPTSRMVDYQAGPFSEQEMDLDSLQAFYLAQEAQDLVEGTISLDTDTFSSWDAGNRRIINVADPVNDTDAANKQSVISMTASQVAAAQASADAAATSEANAATSEANAATSETNAAASELKASKWADEAEDVEVETGRYSAMHWATKADASATQASLSAQGLADTTLDRRIKDALQGEKPGLLIPLYIYPTDIYNNTDYNTVITAAKEHPEIGFHVILNPASGPGTTVDGNYEVAIKRLRAAGAYVYGYVATDYGNRAAADVEADVDQWGALYGLLDGIFFDEMSNTDDQAMRDLYKSYKEYAHGAGHKIAIGNPGTTVPASYFHQDVMDFIVTSEDGVYPDESIYLGDWPDSYMELPTHRRCALVYAQATVDDAGLTLIRKYNGLVYVTSGDLPSPWSVLPSYFGDLVAGLKTAGTPNGLATLDANGEVVQLPAGASAVADPKSVLSADGSWERPTFAVFYNYTHQTVSATSIWLTTTGWELGEEQDSNDWLSADPANGAFTITSDGVYLIIYVDTFYANGYSGGYAYTGVRTDSALLQETIGIFSTSYDYFNATLSVVRRLQAGEVLYPSIWITSSTPYLAGGYALRQFHIVKLK